MMRENDEVMINYFVLCDHVITEAVTSKQSLIGVYSGLISQQFPMEANIAVGVGLRVQSATPRNLVFRFTGPNGERIFESQSLQSNWESVESGLTNVGFATLQFGLNILRMPFARPGVYTAGIFCDGELLATYPLSVQPA